VPTQTFTHSASTQASIEEVWAAFDHPETWEAIGGVDRVFDPTIDGEGRLQGFSFDTIAAGRTYVGKASPRERVEGELISWDVQNPEVRGFTSVSLRPTPIGARITVTLQIETVGLLSSMFFPVVAGAIGNGLPKAVDDFAARFGD
jgi:hypothetical protein